LDDVLASTGRRAGSSSSGGKLSVIGWIALGLIRFYSQQDPGAGFFLDMVFDHRA
jgi:hypothetical protein